MIEVQFFYNMSDDRHVNKRLTDVVTLEGEIRDQSSVTAPAIRFELESLPQFNYAFIPAFNRYYYIDSVTAYRRNLYDISFTVDVLMSFRGDIYNLMAIVERQTDESNGDEYIDDGTFVTENKMTTQVVNYPIGFNDEPVYILITAG